MPSYAFCPRVDAALPPVTGSVHRGPAAPTSLVIVTIAIARSQNSTGRSLPQTRTVGTKVHTAPPPAPGLKRSGGSILRSKTTEGSRTRVLSRCYGHKRVRQARRGRRSMRAATHLSWLMLSHLYSHSPAKTSPTFSTASVITANAVPMMEGAIVLKTASQGTAKMTMLPSHRTNAAGLAPQTELQGHGPTRVPARIRW